MARRLIKVGVTAFNESNAIEQAILDRLIDIQTDLKNIGYQQVGQTVIIRDFEPDVKDFVLIMHKPDLG